MTKVKKRSAGLLYGLFQAFKFLLMTTVKLSLVGLVVLCAYGIYLDRDVRAQFEGKRWAIPSHVYARPLELYQGLVLNREDLIEELNLLGYKEVDSVNRRGSYAMGKEALNVRTRGFQFWDGEEKSRHLKIDFKQNRIAAIYNVTSQSSEDIIRLEPLHIGGIYPSRAEDRVLIKLEEVPVELIALLIAVEDKRFYQHIGLSPKAIMRAVVANIRARSFIQGGSTLTQQLVKNFFLTQERTLWRKFQEAVMAVLLELHYSKEEILEAYLNEVFLGQDGQRAIHGFGLASHYYFGRPIAELELSQQAMLVALVKGASYYNPRRNPDRALQRRNLILGMAADQNLISNELAAEAIDKPLGLVDTEKASIVAFPAFMDLVRRQLHRDYPKQALTSVGLNIFTTMDPLVQLKAERQLTTKLNHIERERGIKKSSLQGAAVVTRTQGGEVLAVVGDRDPKYAGFNRALDALRPIGSLIKPAIYLAALEKPYQYTLATTLQDVDVDYPLSDGSYWSPQNFDKESHGEVLLHVALERSYNQAAAHLGLGLGVPHVIEYLKKLGIEREIEPYPSVLLGALNVSPIEVAQMYQTISADGFKSPIKAIREVFTTDWVPLNRYPLVIEQAVSSDSIYLLTSTMQNVMTSGTGRSATRYLGTHIKAAGKTGTSDQQRDSWFAGFTGDYLAVVWVGRDDNLPTRLTGASGALQVWGEIMQQLSPTPLRKNKPQNIEFAWIDRRNGWQAKPDCQYAEQLPFIKGSVPYEQSRCTDESVVQKRYDWFTLPY